jgi:2-polyprenyl-3-methyl-5-hydroxy-6-metoxy-1,4-benzoquinol methylase
MNYFDLRRNSVDEFTTYMPPENVISLLRDDDRILDFGYGAGYLLRTLRKRGFKNLSGCEIDTRCLASKELDGIDLIDLNESVLTEKYDVIIISHVIEHIEKNKVIEFLKSLKKSLNKHGRLIISTPNAQSTTGVFWLYADFTHEYIYTYGSLYYVLSAAGYVNMRMIGPSKNLYSLLLPLFKKCLGLVNRVTNSFYDHRFENIYSFELIMVCNNNE